ncbi:MAG: hypothetical protein ACK41F_07700 [Fimbriimonadaceae bacterium]
MERWNSEAIPRWELPTALKTRRIVQQAVRTDSCLVCRGPRVNEAGICPLCWPMLDEEELKLAERWLNGSGP